MGFFGMLFWFAVLWFAFKVFRSWSCGSRGGWGDRHLNQRDTVEDQRPYIESLESRIAELEERLDFTERLIAGKRESVA
jgi:hypothetical protein